MLELASFSLLAANPKSLKSLKNKNKQKLWEAIKK